MANRNPFVSGFLCGLMVKGNLTGNGLDPYTFTEDTLVIREETTTLKHSFDWQTMKYSVEVEK